MFARTLVVLLIASSPALAAEKEFVYSQKTGKLTLDGKEVGKGYSGHGEGKDNPDKEAVKNVGPILAGLWKIGEVFKHDTKGPIVMRLTPDGHAAHGRTGFLIHGDNPKMNGTASEGCIILDKKTRQAVANSGTTRLRVVKD